MGEGGVRAVRSSIGGRGLHRVSRGASLHLPATANVCSNVCSLSSEGGLKDA